MANNLTRCGWCLNAENSKHYHDTEWGVPVYDDQRWFEFLILEGMQAGLSWQCILNKRDNYREALLGFDAVAISKFTDKKIEKLLQNPGLIRNRLKMNAIVTNARAFLELQAIEGSFNDYIWQFTDGKPIVNNWKELSDVPATTAISDHMAKDLKKRGFKFVGSTICYALMQATGLVNDHVKSCFRYRECQ